MYTVHAVLVEFYLSITTTTTESHLSLDECLKDGDALGDDVTTLQLQICSSHKDPIATERPTF
jgi:hypothetical protein